jgi:zinc protease
LIPAELLLQVVEKRGSRLMIDIFRFLKRFRVFAVFCILWALFENCKATTNGIIDSEQQGQYSIPIEEAVLDNGLRVIVIRTNSGDSVEMHIVYFVGFGDDARSVVGISHFTEHMMFKGTTSLSGSRLKTLLEKYNRLSNAYTFNDVTVYHRQCRKDFIDINLKIEADRMSNLLLDDEEINKERNVIIEERKMRVESNPRQRYMYEAALKMLYLYSNYSYPGIGYLDQINACTKTAIENHYKNFYVPNNAAIVFAGDITIKEAVKKVGKYFKNIKKGNIQRNRIEDPEDTGLRFTMDHEDAQISMHDLDIIYQINRNLINTMKKTIIVEMVANILAGREDSILHRVLVDEKESVHSVGAYVDHRAYGKGRVSVSMILREGRSREMVDQEVNRIIGAFADKYVTDETVEREKIKLLDYIDMMLDDPGEAAGYVVLNLGNGYKIQDIKEPKRLVKSITTAEVKNAAKAIFTDQNRVLQIYSHPKKP